MENPLDNMVNAMMKLQQLNTLRTIKLETEVMVLKNMVFKNLAKQFDTEYQEIESKHESLTHVALLSQLDVIRPSLPNLDEDEIKKHLGLQG